MHLSGKAVNHAYLAVRPACLRFGLLAVVVSCNALHGGVNDEGQEQALHSVVVFRFGF